MIDFAKFLPEHQAEEKEEVTLQSFRDKTETDPIFNEATASNFATKLSLLNEGQDIDELTSRVRSEVLGQSVPNTKKLLEAAREREAAEAKEFMKQRLGKLKDDPLNKNAVVSDWIDGVGKKLTADELLYNRALKQTVSVEETTPDEVAEMGNMYREAAASRAMEKAAINRANLANNTSMTDTLANFSEALIPFAEWNNFDNISQKLRSDDPDIRYLGIVALGKHKQQLKEWYSNQTLAERRRLIPIIASLVQKNSAVVLDENEMMNADYLRTIIDSDYYGESDYWIDNILGVLDAVGVGFTAKSAVKGVLKGAKKVKVGKIANSPDEAPTNNAGTLPTRDGDVPEIAEEVAKKAPEKKSQGPLDGFQEDGKNASQRVAGETDARVVDEEIADRAKADNITGGPETNSPASVIKEVAPATVAKVVDDVAEDLTDKKAQSWFGRKSSDVIGWMFGPKLGTKGGSTPRMPSITADELKASIRGIVSPSSAQVDTVKSGRISLTDAEKAQSGQKRMDRMSKPATVTGSKTATWVANPTKGVRNTAGQIAARLNESTHTALPDGGRITMNYGPKGPNEFFSTPKRATESIEPALRHAGITSNDVTVMKLDKSGRRWEPATKADLKNNAKGKYLTQVTQRYFHDVKDIDEWSELEDAYVKRNMTDRFLNTNFGGAGTLTSHLLDMASMLNPHITLSANVAVDRASKITAELGQATMYLDNGMRKLPKNRRKKLEDLWYLANQHGFKIDKANNYGLNAVELDLHDTFRSINDTLYALNNAQHRKNLHQRGYRVFNTNDSTHLFVKDVPVAPKSAVQNAYDPITDTVRKLTTDEIDRLYKVGGTLGKLDKGFKTPQGASASHIISMNDSNSWMRRISDNDSPLRYREGYYQVHYRDPIFIKQRRAGGGPDDWYVIGSARNSSDARKKIEALKAHDKKGESEFESRLDKKNNSFDSSDGWSAAMQQGRTAEKIRGKRLGEHDSGAFDDPRILDASEAIERSIHDISQRTSMRDWLDDTKDRTMAQFSGKGVLPKEHGKERWPQKLEDIKGTSKDAGDLRTTWEYIHRMESGWVNHVDDSIKNAMQHMSKMFGAGDNAAAAMAEEFFLNRWHGQGVTGYAKKKVFQAYLALNPLRQVIVQSHQVLQLTPLEPKFVMTKLAGQMALLSMAEIGPQGFAKSKLMKRFLKSNDMSKAEAIDMVSSWRKSGLPDSVSQSNLVRSNWEHAMSGGPLDKAGKLVDKHVIDPVQKIGFDAGERANVKAAWLTFYHRAKVAGKDVKDQAVLDNITAEARNYTLNMNRAGDMPYNQNALGIALQFIQVPHKATTQVLFNRKLTIAERAKLLLWNSTVYGLPASYIVEEYFPDFGVDDPEVREIIKRGAETTVLNWIATQATGEEQNVDYSNLSPWDASALGDVFENIWVDGWSAAWLKSPAGQLASTRVPALFKSMARLTNVVEDYDTPTTLGRVAMDFINLASGPANLSKSFQALYLHEVGKKLNSAGDAQYAATTLEKLAIAAGFRTFAESESVALRIRLSKQIASTKDDARKWLREWGKHMTAEGKAPINGVDAWQLYAEAWRVEGWANNEVVNKEIRSYIRRLIRDPDADFINKVIEKYGEGAMSPNDFRNYIHNYPGISSEQKKHYLDQVEAGFFASLGKE